MGPKCHPHGAPSGGLNADPIGEENQHEPANISQQVEMEGVALIPQVHLPPPNLGALANEILLPNDKDFEEK